MHAKPFVFSVFFMGKLKPFYVSEIEVHAERVIADFFHGEYVTYLSDLNRNGMRDANDITQLQRVLAEIEIE